MTCVVPETMRKSTRTLVAFQCTELLWNCYVNSQGWRHRQCDSSSYGDTEFTKGFLGPICKQLLPAPCVDHLLNRLTSQ